MKEARITINGHTLTEAQSMTIRVAIEIAALDISRNGLGNDQIGKDIAAAYLARINEIRGFVLEKANE